MTRDGSRRRDERRSTAAGSRATSPVVGVVVLLGVTLVLAAGIGTLVAFGQATTVRPPQAQLSATLDATDGWPDGQRLRIVHEGGETIAVDDVELVVTVERTGARARLRAFPTRRLVGEHVRGADLFDRTYAGVDGELDAAHTDGQWAAGESASVRIAQGELDVRPGDRVVVRVIHRPSGIGVTRLAVVAS